MLGDSPSASSPAAGRARLLKLRDEIKRVVAYRSFYFSAVFQRVVRRDHFTI
jgi:hypothetical protein